MKQKKSHKLEGSHELPFVLIAISCSENLLKTAWNINKRLNINLKEFESTLQSKENADVFFPAFCDHNTSDVLFYNLILNKSAGTLLVKGLPNIDYILELAGEIKKVEVSSIIKDVKQIPGVLAAIEISAAKIKRKSAFIQL